MVKETKKEANKLQLFESLKLSKEKIQKIKGGGSDTLPTSGRLDTTVIDDDVVNPR